MRKVAFPHALYFQVFGLKPGRGEDRRIRIIEAFIELLATEGLEKTSFDTLGKKLRMTRTHVAYYFANRDDLIMTAVRYSFSLGQQMMIDQVSTAKTWKERLSIVVSGPFNWLIKYPHHTSMITLHNYMCTYDKKYRELESNILSMGEQRILSCFADRPGLSAREAQRLARSIQALISGAVLNVSVADYSLSMKQFRDVVVETAIDWVETATRKKK